MSLRNLLGLGRRLLRKKADESLPERVETTTLSGLPEFPAQTKLPAIAKSKELVTKDPQIQGPLLVNPMDNLRNTITGSPKAPSQRSIFGSVAHDRIAMKGDGLYTADEWANWLTDRGKRNFKLFGKDFEEGFVAGKRFKYDQRVAKGSHLFNKEVTVPVEELYDSNIAVFNRAGDLTGGILFAAKEAGIKLPGRILADMVKLNPANRIKISEFGVPQAIQTKADNVLQGQLYKLKSIERSLEKNIPVDPTAARADQVAEVVSNQAFVKAYKKDLKLLRNEIRSLRRSILDGNKSAAEDGADNVTRLLAKLKGSATSQQKMALNQMQGEIDDLISSTRTVKSPKYATQDGYTLPGGQNYREAVLSLDERIPGNTMGGRYTNPHYSQKEYSNPIAHIRWDTRKTSDGKKAFLIHEIQSDTNQGIDRFIREKGAEKFSNTLRSNPYQSDIILNYLSQSRKKLSDEILSGKLRPSEMEAKALSVRKIDDTIKDLARKSDASYGTAGSVYDSTTKVDYFPLLDRSSQAKASISYLTNLAAKEGVDYVAVAPQTMLTRGIDKDKVQAYVQFYGYANGSKSPISKSPAVIPDLFKKLAKEYDTKAGKIKISLSDPSKPYKNLRKKDINIPGDKTYKIVEHSDTSSSAKSGFELVPDNDLRLYEDVFSVKVSPNMLSPQKLYKKEGGFIEKYN